MVLDPLNVNDSELLTFCEDLVFCNLCEHVISKEEALGFPEDDPKEWICHKCLEEK